MSWPEEVGRALLAAGVPWLPGMLTDRGERVWQHGQGDDWPDLRDDATRGAVRGWLSEQVGSPVSVTHGNDCVVARCTVEALGEVHDPEWPPEPNQYGRHRATGADWREAEARALLALAREVLA